MENYGTRSEEYKKELEWFSGLLSKLEEIRKNKVAEFNSYLRQHKKSKNNPDVDYKIRDKNLSGVKEIQNQLKVLKYETKEIQRNLSNFKTRR